VTIGWPIAKTRAYVLDADLELAPVGVPGELYIGGAGLARGYIGRGALTAQRFVPNPFAAGAPANPVDGAGERLYRTGELARWRPDGALEFLGRLDRQTRPRDRHGEIEVERASAGGEPQTATERLVAEIWRCVLQVPQVGVDDNFFEIGGHSRAIVSVQARLSAAVGHEISVADLFRHPNLRALAAFIDGAGQAKQAPRRERATRRVAAHGAAWGRRY
jgi:hypothetical protein